MVKTWSEDNWFTRLDRLFEYQRYSQRKPCHIKLLDKNPKTPRLLRPDNISKFPKLWQDYFHIYMTVPTAPTLEDPDVSNSESVFRNFKESLKDFHKQISKRGYVEESRALEAAELEENTKLEIAARNFYLDTLHFAINLYKEMAKESIRQTREKNIEYLESLDSKEQQEYEVTHFLGAAKDPRNEERYFNYYFDPIERELDSLYEDLSNKSIRTIPRDQLGINSPYARSTTFEVRLIKNTCVVYINVKSKLLTDGTPDYTTDLVGVKGRSDRNKLEDLKDKYKCGSFITAMPALRGGNSNSSDAEKSFCSEESVQEFFKSGIYERALGKGYFRKVHRSVYDTLVANSSAVVKVSVSNDLPSLEALHTAEFTDDLFSEKLGGTLDLDSDDNLIIRLKSGEILSVQDAQERWKPAYKADVIYVVDHPSEKYPDNTPVKLILPIQVKYLKSNSNVLAGHLAASRKLLRKLKDNLSSNNPLIREIISVLIYRGYVLAVDSWERTYFLGSNPPVKKKTEFSKADEDNKDFIADFSVGGCNMRLRIPDIDVIEKEEKERLEKGKTYKKTPEIRLAVV